MRTICILLRHTKFLSGRLIFCASCRKIFQRICIFCTLYKTVSTSSRKDVFIFQTTRKNIPKHLNIVQTTEIISQSVWLHQIVCHTTKVNARKVVTCGLLNHTQCTKSLHKSSEKQSLLPTQYKNALEGCHVWRAQYRNACKNAPGKKFGFCVGAWPSGCLCVCCFMSGASSPCVGASLLVSEPNARCREARRLSPRHYT